MDYTVKFVWKTKSYTAVLVPDHDAEQPSLCAFLKDEELINDFGPSINIRLQPTEHASIENESLELNKAILRAASNLPVIEKLKMKGVAAEELRERLKMLEHDYGKRFTGLNNHKLLSNLWGRIKVIKEELEKRKEA